MIDRPLEGADADVRLQAMVSAIVEGVRPARVILFGSRARGDARPDSDYDLVVELDFERSDYWQTYHRVSRALRPAKDGASVDVLIRQPGEIEAKRDDPGYMDWMIAREGIVVHPPGGRNEALRSHAPRGLACASVGRTSRSRVGSSGSARISGSSSVRSTPVRVPRGAPLDFTPSRWRRST